MRVLGPLLLDLSGMQDETAIPAPLETAGNAGMAATKELDHHPIEHPPTPSRGYTPGTQ